MGNSIIDGRDEKSLSIKKRRFLLFLLVFLAAFLPAFSETDEEESFNLLYNGDFEILDEEGLPDGWFTDAYRMDPGYTIYSVSDGMNGGDSKAAELNNLAKNDARYAQVVGVKPNSLYCLSGYIRADEIESGHGANLSIEGVYAFSRKVYDTDGEWNYIEYYGETGDDQDEITVFARVGGYSGESKGSASFDHLVLKEVESVPQGIYPDSWYQVHESTGASEDDRDDAAEEEGQPAWPILAAIGILYTLLVVAVLYNCRDGEARLNGDDRINRSKFIPFLLLSLGLRMILSCLIEGYAVDVNCFSSWGYTMAHFGPTRFYQQTSFCDYPPLYMYVIGLNSWLSALLQTGSGLTRLIFRFIPCLCDVAACWILLFLPKNNITKSRYFGWMIILLSFNPATIVNSAAWGQMDSVLCLLLVLVAICAVERKWIRAIAFFVTAVLVKPQALMLGFLGLTYMILAAVREKEDRKRILIGTGIGLLLMAVFILPFGIGQEPGWLVSRYADTLASYPYATINTANMYYLLGGNWSSIESAAHAGAPAFLALACAAFGVVRFIRNRKERYILIELITAVLFSLFFIGCICFHAGWTPVGTAAMAYAFVIVITLALRSRDVHFLPYLGSMLFILLYVFGVKMHERYLFPAIFLLMYAWTLHKDRRILYLILLFSLTVFVNEGIVLDNSIRLGSARGHLNEDTVWLADLLSVFNICGAVYATYLGNELLECRKPGSIRGIPSFLPVRKIPSEKRITDYCPDRRLHWKIRDTVILLSICAVYSAVVLTTLGSTKAPQTAWSSSGEDEQVIIDLQEKHEDFEILYFGQVSREDFSVAQSDDGENWSEETSAQMDEQQCWKWKYVTMSYPDGNGGRTYYNSLDYICHFSGRYIRITSGQVGLVLNEILFRDAEGKIIPASVLSRSGDYPDSALWSDPAYLLDEQDSLENLPGLFGNRQAGPDQPSWWNSTYFDEIYHARTGFEFLKGTVPYETSHPPLGKVLISWSISLFGMTPFGWRFAGAAAGILMLPGIYLLAKQLTKRTWPGALACGLMALDCMHLTQTQIATIDSFPVLFILYAFFFMLRFIQTDPAGCRMREMLIPLALSGLSMGLAIASKWIGIYAGLGLAVLYFGHWIHRIRMGQNEENPEADIIQRFFKVSLWCILFFVVIPLAVYLLSYIPYMAYNTRIRSLKDYLDAVWRAQEGMLNYHSTPGLGMDHPFYSPWWEWPIIGKPMYYATEQYIMPGTELHHSIFCFGNPLIWWGSLAAILILAGKWIQEKHYRIEGTEQNWHLKSLTWNNQYAFVFIGLLAQYLPWVLVPRGTYIYHYFASIPFLILISVLCVPSGTDKKNRAGYWIGSVCLALAAVFFILLFPYASGMPSPTGWLDIGKNLLRIWY